MGRLCVDGKEQSCETLSAKRRRQRIEPLAYLRVDRTVAGRISDVRMPEVTA